MALYLAYSSLPLPDSTAFAATFSTVLPTGATGAQTSFNPLKYSDPKPMTTTSAEGATLAGRLYKHIAHSHNYYDCSLSPTQIDSTAFSFLSAFWVSPNKYINIDGTGDYIPVITDGDELPVEYINDIKALKNIQMKFTCINKN